MTTSTKEQIALRAIAYRDVHNLTNADLAKKSGVRGEYLTHIFRDKSDFTVPTGGKPTPIADKYFQKLADFIGFSLVNTYWELKPTSQLTQSLAILSEAKEFGETSIIIGETGCGKSQSIEVFQRKNPADTFVVTVGSSDNLGDLIDKIAEQLFPGKGAIGKTKSKKLRYIVSRLKTIKENGGNPQLIFDEAEYMKQHALCSIKELYDHLNQYCALMLIGTEQLIENIESLRKRNKPGIPQFYRRIKFGIRKLPPVDRSFKLFLEGLSPDVQVFLRQICDNYGELHDVLVPVRREAERTGEEITEGFIKKVLNLSNIAA